MADELASLLYDANKTTFSFTQLILISDDLSLFPYLPIYKHEVSVQNKIELLETTLGLESYIEKEPLNMLQARLNYMKTYKHVSASQAWTDLESLSMRYPEADVEPKLRAIKTNEFLNHLKNTIRQYLNCQPYVVLVGLTGVGKSTFIHQDFVESGETLYCSESEILAWATDYSSSTCYLFLDEANLSDKNWLNFEGLFQDPPSILINGVMHRLTSHHKVIFACNPKDYNQRNLPELFSRHGGAIHFPMLPEYFIVEKILKPLFDDTHLMNKFENISKYVLKMYDFVLKCSNTEVLISPREIEMMALLTLSYTKYHANVSLEEVMTYICNRIALPLIPKQYINKFQDLVAPGFIAEIVPKMDDFIVTPSRHACLTLLTLLMELRHYRQHDAQNDVQKYGGLGGIIITGDSGIGKSEMIRQLLEYQKDSYYFIPISMPQHEKEELLLKAFDEGAIVLIDEINSCFLLEPLLYSLLMGKTLDNKRPSKPGFMIFATQNPITMEGRIKASPAFARRFVFFELNPYPDEELKDILSSLNINKDDVEALVRAFQKQYSIATQQNFSPKPNLRNLLRLGEKIATLRADEKEIFSSIKESNGGFLENNYLSRFFKRVTNTNNQQEELDEDCFRDISHH